MDGWKGGWMNERMDGWKDGWMDGCSSWMKEIFQLKKRKKVFLNLIFFKNYY